jgi:uncharacterized protein YjfI (DUF2170 family)
LGARQLSGEPAQLIRAYLFAAKREIVEIISYLNKKIIKFVNGVLVYGYKQIMLELTCKNFIVITLIMRYSDITHTEFETFPLKMRKEEVGYLC